MLIDATTAKMFCKSLDQASGHNHAVGKMPFDLRINVTMRGWGPVPSSNSTSNKTQKLHKPHGKRSWGLRPPTYMCKSIAIVYYQVRFASKCLEGD